MNHFAQLSSELPVAPSTDPGHLENNSSYHLSLTLKGTRYLATTILTPVSIPRPSKVLSLPNNTVQTQCTSVLLSVTSYMQALLLLLI